MNNEARIALIEEVERLLWRLSDGDDLVRVALAAGMTVDEVKEHGGI